MGITWRLLGPALLAGTTVPVSAQIGAGETPLHLSRMTLGYSYFNKAGAAFAEHDADILECAHLASKLVSLDTQMGGGAQYGLIGAIVGGLIAKAADNGVFAASLENCMVVRGWRVVKVTDAEGTSLSALPKSDLRTRLSEWVGAESPHGTIVRVWNNDAANATVPRYSNRPGRTKKGHLSLVATDSAALEAAIKPPETSKEKIKPTKLDPKWPVNALKVANITTAPEGSAVIIVDIKGLNLNTLLLRRIGATPTAFPSELDRAPDVLFVVIGTLLKKKKEGNFRAYAVPPGRWSIAGMGMMPSLSFCLGAPSFVVGSGEVVYTGELDLKSERMVPDLSLDRVRAWLTGTPAATKVRPADYLNGTLGPCSPNSIYALEFEGFPFEPGYKWGSRTKKPASDANAAATPTNPSAGQ
jgi:hypothetical protein